jgi:hypothetical protein
MFDFLYTVLCTLNCWFEYICKRLKSPTIDSKESIPPAYAAWRAGTSNRVVVPARQAGNRFLASLKGLQIRAQSPTQCKVLCNIACRRPWFDTGQPSGPFLDLNFKCLYREIENRCKT